MRGQEDFERGSKTRWTRHEEPNYDELAREYMQETLAQSVHLHFRLTSEEMTLTSPSRIRGSRGGRC